MKQSLESSEQLIEYAYYLRSKASSVLLITILSCALLGMIIGCSFFYEETSMRGIWTGIALAILGTLVGLIFSWGTTIQLNAQSQIFMQFARLAKNKTEGK